MDIRALRVYMQIDDGDITTAGEGLISDEQDVAALLRALAGQVEALPQE